MKAIFASQLARYFHCHKGATQHKTRATKKGDSPPPKATSAAMQDDAFDKICSAMQCANGQGLLHNAYTNAAGATCSGAASFGRQMAYPNSRIDSAVREYRAWCDANRKGGAPALIKRLLPLTLDPITGTIMVRPVLNWEGFSFDEAAHQPKYEAQAHDVATRPLFPNAALAALTQVIRSMEHFDLSPAPSTQAQDSIRKDNNVRDAVTNSSLNSFVSGALPCGSPDISPATSRTEQPWPGASSPAAPATPIPTYTPTFFESRCIAAAHLSTPSSAASSCEQLAPGLLTRTIPSDYEMSILDTWS